MTESRQQEDLDSSVWSNMRVDGARLTWREAYEHMRERHEHEQALAAVLADLDRCFHGRHEGDTCSECNGPSKGNPYAMEGEVIGYGLGGGRQPIIMPPRAKRRDPQAWYRMEDR